MAKKAVTNDGKKGGWLVGKRHYDKTGKPLGGIKAIVTDAGNRPVELEGGEVIINREASKKYWKELSKINQSAGNGVAIGPPSDSFDEDPSEDYENGGKIEFNANHIPNKWILNYAIKIKEDHPEIWKLGGNIFGNEAFVNLKRVAERGHWLDSEEWMYKKWRSYVARHQRDYRIEGVVAMLKWVDKVEKGWQYMKNLIEEKIKKIEAKESKKMKDGGSVGRTPAPLKDRIKGSKFNPSGTAKDAKSGTEIKFDDKTVSSIKSMIDAHNEKHPSKKITLGVAKAVVRRGMGAYSSSHRPTITGGKPNSRTAWGLARLKAFIYKAEKGKSKSGKYSQDNDLFGDLDIKVSKLVKGGKILNAEEEQSFKEWMEDGNVHKFEDGYSTQDAQWRNRLKGLDELRKYFRKEFLSDNYGYADGGKLEKQVLSSEYYENGGGIDYDSIQPKDKNGVPKIDDKSLKILTERILELPQTKSFHTDSEGNYTKERKELHKEIINEFKKQAVCITKGKPIAILMGGSPASGKSSFIRKYRPYLMVNDIVKVDADEIRAKLPEYKGFNATQTHLETKDIVNTLISDRNIGVPCNFDLIYDGTMNSVKSYEPLIDLLKKRNYKVYIIYIDRVPYETVVSRMKERYKKSGRFVPIEVIDDFFSKGRTALDKLKKEVDGYVIVDGSNFDYNIIERGGEELPQERDHKFLGELIDQKQLETIEYKGGGKVGGGDCYKTAGDFVLDSKLFGETRTNKIKFVGEPHVVHAEVTGQGEISGLKYGHAWVEDDVLVYDYSNGRKLEIPRNLYYAVGKIKTTKPRYFKYTFEQARKKMLDSGHYGPWDLKTESGL
jgi:predicted ABC-type ATPase